MTDKMELEEALVELIRLASTNLPPDQIEAMQAAAAREPENSMARKTFEMMLANARAASETSTPTCQDTGTLLFYVHYGPEHRQRELTRTIEGAVKEATRHTFLRPNAVDSLTGRNSGDNTGTGSPYVHFEEQDEPGLSIRLMLKGGGSENMGRQYTLPDSALGAGRDLEGVRLCVVDGIALQERRRRTRRSRYRGARTKLARRVQRVGNRADGLRRQDLRARRQDLIPSPRARQLLRIDYLHVLGQPQGEDELRRWCSRLRAVRGR